MDILKKWGVFWEKFGPGGAWERVICEGLVNTLIIAFVGLLIGIVISFVQLAFCRWWLSHHKYGPLEGIWRRWTWI